MCLTFEFLITNFLIFVEHSKAIFWGFKLNSKVHKCVCWRGSVILIFRSVDSLIWHQNLWSILECGEVISLTHLSYHRARHTDMEGGE